MVIVTSDEIYIKKILLEKEGTFYNGKWFNKLRRCNNLKKEDETIIAIYELSDRPQ